VRLPSFLASFFKAKEPESLPLSVRITQLEGDMLAVRATVDSMQTTTRKLQGKVYRGVPLGDTVDADPKPDQEEPVAPPVNVFEKGELYRRAAQLRGR